MAYPVFLSPLAVVFGLAESRLPIAYCLLPIADCHFWLGLMLGFD